MTISFLIHYALQSSGEYSPSRCTVQVGLQYHGDTIQVTTNVVPWYNVPYIDHRRSFQDCDDKKDEQMWKEFVKTEEDGSPLKEESKQKAKNKGYPVDKQGHTTFLLENKRSRGQCMNVPGGKSGITLK